MIDPDANPLPSPPRESVRPGPNAVNESQPAAGTLSALALSGATLRLGLMTVGLSLLPACQPEASAQKPLERLGSPTLQAAPVYGYQVVESFPHDPRAFTEGLVYFDGLFYESTGINFFSSVREVDVETGRVLRKERLTPRYFGEGLTLWQDQLIQLTYTTEEGFVWDRLTFEQLDTFAYSGEGWGLTHNGTELIMSNGSSQLLFLDPVSYEVTHSITVTDAGQEVRNLNELEYIDGKVYANIWLTDEIAIIDPEDGVVEARVDLTGLLPEDEALPWSDVLNGIAWDAQGMRLFVTGKCWPKLYHIQLVAPSP
jgi:glutamine cyclotransferase